MSACAFVGTYSFENDSVNFCSLPVVDGFLVDNDERISLDELESDGYSDTVAVVDERDSPELRDEISRLLNRRFEYLREATRRQKPLPRGMTSAKLLARPMLEMTLQTLQRSSWASEEAKKVSIDFFKEHGTLPNFDNAGNPTEYPDFPEIPGSIGDLCDAVCPDVPYLFKVGACLAHFGLLRSGLDTLEAEPFLQPRSYVIEVAKPGRGKTAAVKEITAAMKTVSSGIYQTLPSVDSGPSLVDRFGDKAKEALIKADAGDSVDLNAMAKILLSPDEHRGFMEKAKISVGSRNSLLDELLKLFEGNSTGSSVRGAKINLQLTNAHLAYLAGATPSSYQNSWIATGGGSDGLQTRITVLAADLPRMPSKQRKTDIEKATFATQRLIEQAKAPAKAYEISDSAFKIFDDWWSAKPEGNDQVTRIDGIVKRLLIILARCNDVEVIGDDLMRVAIAFGDYVQFCREKHNPPDASNNVQSMENRIIAEHEKKGHEQMTHRDCARHVRPERHPGGYVAFNQAHDALKKSRLKVVGKNGGGFEIFALSEAVK